MAAAAVGREAELEAVDEALSAARECLRSLVVEGEPGIGKTTIWRAGIERAAREGYRVLSCRPAQAETRLSFAGLGDLLEPVGEEWLAVLPDPQRRALEIALLREEADGPAPDPRAIGTGLVSLVAKLVGDGPVLLAVDDVQWLDRPTERAFEFALRRLEERPVLVLTTLRHGERGGRTGLHSAVSGERARRCPVGPLSLGALYEVLRPELGRRLTRPLLVSIEQASRGNPFYALELARALQADGRPESGAPLPIPDDLRTLVSQRLRRLPRRTREALLEVSALAQPTTSLVDLTELAPAEEAGVVRTRADRRIEFTHPLFSGAVYTGASRERRRRLHRDLAERSIDLEERARHLALACDGPDAQVAELLDRAAEHARARGAPEAAAELAEQAADRTPAEAGEVQRDRCLRAAQHHFKAGDRERARVQAERVVETAPPALRSHVLLLLAEIAASEQIAMAVALLQEALACADDVAQAAELELALGMMGGATVELDEADGHLVRAIEFAEEAGATAVLADALAMQAMVDLQLGRGFDEEALQRALLLEDPERDAPFFMVRASLNVAQVFEFIGRLDPARELLSRLHDRIVARGEETDLPLVSIQLAFTLWLSGELALAADHVDEALRVSKLTGQELFAAFALGVRALVAAVAGDLEGARSDAAEALDVSERIGWAHGIRGGRWGLAVVALSEDDPAAAVAALDPIVATIEAIGVYEFPLAMMLPDAIEAYVASGDLERAASLVDSFGDWGRRLDRPWVLATSGRCRALLEAANGRLGSARAAAEQALVDHERLPMPFEQGRTLLVFGQIQRRRGERRAARETLGRAVTVFEDIGAPLWAEKARAEIRRIGVRRAPAELTENERRVAELAAVGLTNREIAAKMFLSRRTVEANLARAYRKLGIHSRAELGATMAAYGGHVPS